MRILFSFFLLLSTTLKGQTFSVDTILMSGSVDKHINFVIIPDGYQEAELAQFNEDAKKFAEVFFDTPPFNYYKSYFNVFTINVPSNESGADHPGTATDVSEPAHPVEDVDNYFGSTFDYYDIHRLLVPLNESNIYSVLAMNFPAYDQVIILANTPHYGGSGGEFATASLHSASIEVTTHELGHSFAGLADEYYAGDFYAGERVNMTQETDPLKVKWKNWIDENGVGIYQHCCGGNSASWYRPHENCKMRTLGAPFCPVCSENIVERIHILAPPLLAFSPENLELSNDELPLLFSLELIHPQPNSLQVTWELNDVVINDTTEQVLIEDDSLVDGENFLIAYIQDTTALIRSAAHDQFHIYTVIWKIDNESLSKHITGSKQLIDISLFPNPASDILNVWLKEPFKGGNMKLVISDGSGVNIAQHDVADSGKQIDLTNYAKGAYYLKFYVGKTLIAVKPLIIN